MCAAVTINTGPHGSNEMAEGLQEEMMAAAMGFHQAAVAACAEVCAHRLRLLQTHLQQGGLTPTASTSLTGQWGMQGRSNSFAGTAASLPKDQSASRLGLIVQGIRRRLEAQQETATNFLLANFPGGRGLVSRDQFIASFAALAPGASQADLLELFSQAVGGTERDALLEEIAMLFEGGGGSAVMAPMNVAIPEAERVIHRVRNAVSRSGRSFEEVFRGFCRSGGELMSQGDLTRVLRTFEPGLDAEIVLRLWRATVPDGSLGLDFPSFCLWFCPGGHPLSTPVMVTPGGSQAGAFPSSLAGGSGFLAPTPGSSSSHLGETGHLLQELLMAPGTAAGSTAAMTTLHPSSASFPPTRPSSGSMPPGSGNLLSATQSQLQSLGLTPPVSPTTRPLSSRSWGGAGGGASAAAAARAAAAAAAAGEASEGVATLAPDQLLSPEWRHHQGAGPRAGMQQHTQQPMTNGAPEARGPDPQPAAASGPLPITKDELPAFASLLRLQRGLTARRQSVASALVVYDSNMENAVEPDGFLAACENHGIALSRREIEDLFSRLARSVAHGRRRLFFDDLEAALRSLPDAVREEQWGKNLIVAMDKMAKTAGAPLEKSLRDLGKEAVSPAEFRSILSKHAPVSDVQWAALLPLLDKRLDGTLPWADLLRWAGIDVQVQAAKPNPTTRPATHAVAAPATAAPATAMSSVTKDRLAPLSGSQTPLPGGQAPAGQTPLPGGQTPLPGGQTPLPGGTPLPGNQTTMAGGQTPLPGGQTPLPGSQTPLPGGQTPLPGEQAALPGSQAAPKGPADAPRAAALPGNQGTGPAGAYGTPMTSSSGIRPAATTGTVAQPQKPLAGAATPLSQGGGTLAGQRPASAGPGQATFPQQQQQQQQPQAGNTPLAGVPGSMQPGGQQQQPLGSGHGQQHQLQQQRPPPLAPLQHGTTVGQQPTLAGQKATPAAQAPAAGHHAVSGPPPNAAPLPSGGGAGTGMGQSSVLGNHSSTAPGGQMGGAGAGIGQSSVLGNHSSTAPGGQMGGALGAGASGLPAAGLPGGTSGTGASPGTLPPARSGTQMGNFAGGGQSGMAPGGLQGGMANSPLGAAGGDQVQAAARSRTPEPLGHTGASHGGLPSSHGGLRSGAQMGGVVGSGQSGMAPSHQQGAMAPGASQFTTTGQRTPEPPGHGGASTMGHGGQQGSLSNNSMASAPEPMGHGGSGGAAGSTGTLPPGRSGTQMGIAAGGGQTGMAAGGLQGAMANSPLAGPGGDPIRSRTPEPLGHAGVNHGGLPGSHGGLRTGAQMGGDVGGGQSGMAPSGQQGAMAPGTSQFTSPGSHGGLRTGAQMGGVAGVGQSGMAPSGQQGAMAPGASQFTSPGQDQLQGGARPRTPEPLNHGSTMSNPLTGPGHDQFHGMTGARNPEPVGTGAMFQGGDQLHGLPGQRTMESPGHGTAMAHGGGLGAGHSNARTGIAPVGLQGSMAGGGNTGMTPGGAPGPEQFQGGAAPPMGHGTSALNHGGPLGSHSQLRGSGTGHPGGPPPASVGGDQLQHRPLPPMHQPQAAVGPPPPNAAPLPGAAAPPPASAPSTAAQRTPSRGASESIGGQSGVAGGMGYQGGQLAGGTTGGQMGGGAMANGPVAPPGDGHLPTASRPRTPEPLGHGGTGALSQGGSLGSYSTLRAGSQMGGSANVAAAGGHQGSPGGDPSLLNSAPTGHGAAPGQFGSMGSQPTARLAGGLSGPPSGSSPSSMAGGSHPPGPTADHLQQQRPLAPMQPLNAGQQPPAPGAQKAPQAPLGQAAAPPPPNAAPLPSGASTGGAPPPSSGALGAQRGAMAAPDPMAYQGQHGGPAALGSNHTGQFSSMPGGGGGGGSAMQSGQQQQHHHHQHQHHPPAGTPGMPPPPQAQPQGGMAQGGGHYEPMGGPGGHAGGMMGAGATGPSGLGMQSGQYSTPTYR